MFPQRIGTIRTGLGTQATWQKRLAEHQMSSGLAMRLGRHCFLLGSP